MGAVIVSPISSVSISQPFEVPKCRMVPENGQGAAANHGYWSNLNGLDSESMIVVVIDYQRG